MNIRLLSAALGFLAIATTANAAIAIVDNLANQNSGPGLIERNHASAQAFTTDNKSYQLESATAKLGQPDGGAGLVEFQLRADNPATGAPGAVIRSWPGIAVSGSAFKDVSTPVAGNVILQPLKKYWLVVRTTSGKPVEWTFTSSSVHAGNGTPGGRAFTEALTVTPDWQLSGGGVFHQFAITGNELVPTFGIAGKLTEKPEGTPGGTPFIFSITRTLGTGGSASVDFAVTGSGASPAKPDDFAIGTFPSGTINFTPGETKQDIVILVKGDAEVESTDQFTVTLSNPGGDGVIQTPTATASILNDDSIPPLLIGLGGTAAHVKVIDGVNLGTTASFFAFDGFTGGVRVAAGDFNGDGVQDTIAAAGPGAGPHVKVFDGNSGAEIRSFFAYGPSFSGGVYVAAGDVNGDQIPDVITGAGTVSPHVKVFSGADNSTLRSFFAFPGFSGGVRVAAGDVNGDGFADIITGAGPGAGPHVKAFSGANGSLLRSFFAYDAGFTGGIFVAAGDVNGDGAVDIITGTDSGVASHVKAFSGATGAEIRSFLAYGPTFTGGVRVAAGDVNGDGISDIITGAGAGAGPHVKVFDGVTSAEIRSFFAFDAAITDGIFPASIANVHQLMLGVHATGPGAGKVTGRLLLPVIHAATDTIEEAAVPVAVGQTIELLATPAKGCVFNGWSDENGILIGMSEKLVFRMSFTRNVRATFVPNPFAPVRGTYSGIVDTGGLAGFITATVSEVGVLTGKIQIGARTIPLRGEVLGSGEFEGDFKFGKGEVFRVSFDLNTKPGRPHQLNGTILQIAGSNGPNPLSGDFRADAQIFSAKNPAPQLGVYTLLLERNPIASAAFPHGVGFARVNVTKNGVATFVGKLGDTTPVAFSRPLAGDGTLPFFASLYGNHGSIAGQLNFRDQPTTDIDGMVDWFKEANVAGTTRYVDGFHNSSNAFGVNYVKPQGAALPEHCAFLLNAPSANFKAGPNVVALPPIASNDNADVDANNKVTLPQDERALKCTVNAATGAVSGSFTEVVSNRKTVFSFNGVILLPKGTFQGDASGCFPRGDRAGSVQIFDK